ncbi:MAG TPA: hypothetical protein VMH82_03525 [Myxococcota bacterium]|nr:hypothetical protein [Myxococcota bacterium]
MSGRIRICEDDAALPGASEAVELVSDASGGEEGIRSALDARLEAVRAAGGRKVAVRAPNAGVAGVSLQRCAEILLGEARRHLSGATSIEEVRFLVRGEPALRLYESVDDATRIAAQAQRRT